MHVQPNAPIPETVVAIINTVDLILIALSSGLCICLSMLVGRESVAGRVRERAFASRSTAERVEPPICVRVARLGS
jgi:hypothetical protein